MPAYLRSTTSAFSIRTVVHAVITEAQRAIAHRQNLGRHRDVKLTLIINTGTESLLTVLYAYDPFLDVW